jgi:16S rRNA processing protein RimM
MARARVDIPPGFVSIGRVAGPFGIRGELKLEAHAAWPEPFHPLSNVTARWADGRSRPVRILGGHPHKTHILIRMEGVDDANAAEEYRGAVLVIPIEDRPPLPSDTYYTADLVGMLVVTTDGEEIGPITEVYAAPAGDVWVTERGAFPAVKAFVQSVDMEARRVIVQAIPGTFSPAEEA